ncbi:MAG: NADH-quinone oxidoreductase subunit C [Rhodobacteraceae bacterium]|nr:NADH-quinone oxidoreductase subunit C [Paracoccaceae bacterium]
MTDIPSQSLPEYIASVHAESVFQIEVCRGTLAAGVTRAGLPGLVDFLQTDSRCLFQTLIDITAIDHPGRDKRFDVVYHLLSMDLNQRIRLKVQVAEDSEMPSISTIHPSANWYEREVFDMFGIVFSGHPDLRRILTDYGFSGHPLRKDFPVTGHTEVRYDEVRKRVVSEPVTLVQDYRQFDFMSPWEGSRHIMDSMDSDSAESGS